MQTNLYQTVSIWTTNPEFAEAVWPEILMNAEEIMQYHRRPILQTQDLRAPNELGSGQ